MKSNLKVLNLNLKYLPAILYMALIFYMSSIPVPKPVGQILIHFDPEKHLAHLVEYAILSILLYLASRDYCKSFIIGALYGLSDEIHQYFVPTRFFDLFDLTFDCIGALVGALLASLMYKVVIKKVNKLGVVQQQRVCPH